MPFKFCANRAIINSHLKHLYLVLPSGNDDILSHGWTCSTSDIVSHYWQKSSSSLDFVTRIGDDLMSSVMIKGERNDEEDDDSAFVLHLVSDDSKPVEDHLSAEELLVEETVFSDDCKAMACSAGERQVDSKEDQASEVLPPSVNCFMHLPSSDLKNLENGTSFHNVVHLPSTKVSCAVHHPKVISDILVFCCSHCDSQYLNEETGQKHLRCLHPHSDGTLVAEVVKTAYVCCTCSQSFHDCSQWQLHMKTVHSVFSGMATLLATSLVS